MNKKMKDPPDLTVDYSKLYKGYKYSSPSYKRIGYKSYDINDGSFQGLLTQDKRIVFFVDEETLEIYEHK